MLNTVPPSSPSPPSCPLSALPSLDIALGHVSRGHESGEEDMEPEAGGAVPRFSRWVPGRKSKRYMSKAYRPIAGILAPRKVHHNSLHRQFQAVRVGHEDGAVFAGSYCNQDGLMWLCRLHSRRSNGSAWAMSRFRSGSQLAQASTCKARRDISEARPSRASYTGACRACKRTAISGLSPNLREVAAEANVLAGSSTVHWNRLPSLD